MGLEIHVTIASLHAYMYAVAATGELPFRKISCKTPKSTIQLIASWLKLAHALQLHKWDDKCDAFITTTCIHVYTIRSKTAPNNITQILSSILLSKKNILRIPHTKYHPLHPSGLWDQTFDLCKKSRATGIVHPEKWLGLYVVVTVATAYFAGFMSRVIFIGAMASLPYIIRDPGVEFRCSIDQSKRGLSCKPDNSALGYLTGQSKDISPRVDESSYGVWGS